MQIKTKPNIQAQGSRGKNGPAANGIVNRRPNIAKMRPINLASSADVSGLVGSTTRKMIPRPRQNKYNKAINTQ
jgi:hypothetical protein